jgi:CubicO group peptidase (beta-lactamase class C family)
MNKAELQIIDKKSKISIRVFVMLCCFLIASIIIPPVLQAQTNTKRILDSLLMTFPQNGAGGVVVVLDQGKIIYSGTYGYANIEWNIPNAVDIKYRIGSITKTFTALAVLQLAEKGQLSLKDKAKKWLPETDMDDRITIEYLLSHTSGIQSGKKELEFNPGERMNYSNYGYILLGQIVSKVSGIPYEEYLKKNIFVPLGMNGSGYDHNENILAKRASGYRITEKGFTNAPYMDMKVPGAAGGLYSTAQDLIIFEKSLNGNSIFSKSLLDSAFKPFVLSDGSKAKYGFGWIVNNYRGWREISTGGDIEGFNSYFAHFPDQKLTVIVLQNITMLMGADWSGGGRLAHHIIDLVWGNELQPTVKIIELPKEKLQILTGIYEFENATEELISANGPSLIVTEENGKLFVQAKDKKIPVEPISDTEFIVPGMDISIKFLIGSNRKASDLTMNLMGVREYKAKRIQ